MTSARTCGTTGAAASPSGPTACGEHRVRVARVGMRPFAMSIVFTAIRARMHVSLRALGVGPAAAGYPPPVDSSRGLCREQDGSLWHMRTDAQVRACACTCAQVTVPTQLETAPRRPPRSLARPECRQARRRRRRRSSSRHPIPLLHPSFQCPHQQRVRWCASIQSHALGRSVSIGSQQMRGQKGRVARLVRVVLGIPAPPALPSHTGVHFLSCRMVWQY